MIRLTDVDLTLHFHGLDLTTIDNTTPIVAIKQGIEYREAKAVTIADAEKMIATFEQKDTVRFKQGDAELQVNYWIGGKRKAIDKIPISIGDNITNRVISVE